MDLKYLVVFLSLISFSANADGADQYTELGLKRYFCNSGGLMGGDMFIIVNEKSKGN